MAKLRLVSYNLDHSNKKETIAENILSLAHTGVEIFCLQEVRARKDEEFIGDFLLKKLGNVWQGRFLISYSSKNDLGLGFIWDSVKLQASGFEELRLPVLEKLFNLERFIESYFLSGDPSPVKRAALIGEFSLYGQRIRISNTHLDWHGGFSHRLRQLEVLVNHLNKNPRTNEIICGDLNTIGVFGNEEQVKKIQTLLGPDFVNFFPEFTITTAHRQHLDHIFGKNTKLKKAEVIMVPGSDHYPIQASLELDLESAVSVPNSLAYSNNR